LRADREVLMEVDDNSELIVGNPKGILGQQLMPHTNNFLNIIITYTITLLNWWQSHLRMEMKVNLFWWFLLGGSPMANAGNTKGGSITVPLTSCLTGLESAVWQLTIFVHICKTD
jgi:hypothetical protein